MHCPTVVINSEVEQPTGTTENAEFAEAAVDWLILWRGLADHRLGDLCSFAFEEKADYTWMTH